jgi:hypothetical protein
LCNRCATIQATGNEAHARLETMLSAALYGVWIIGKRNGGYYAVGKTGF